MGKEPRNMLLEVPVAQLWGNADTVTTVHRVERAEFNMVVFFHPEIRGENALCLHCMVESGR